MAEAAALAPQPRGDERKRAIWAQTQTPQRVIEPNPCPVSTLRTILPTSPPTGPQTPNALHRSSRTTEEPPGAVDRAGANPSSGGSRPGPKPELPSGPEPQIGSIFDDRRAHAMSPSRGYTTSIETSSQTGAGTSPLAGATSPATMQRPIMPRGTETVSPPSEPPPFAHPKRERPTRRFHG